MWRCIGNGYLIHCFLNFDPDGGEWSPSSWDYCTIWERDSNGWWIRGLMGTTPGLDAVNKRKISFSCVIQTAFSWSLSWQPNHCPDWGVYWSCIVGHARTPIRETKWNVSIFPFNEALLLLCNVKVVLYKVSCDIICNIKSKIVFLCTAVHWQDE